MNTATSLPRTPASGAPGGTSSGPHIRLPQGGRILSTGLGFTEGPCTDGPGHLLVTSINRGSVYRIPLESGQEPELAFECGGGPNGLAVGPNGTIFVAQNGSTAMASKSQLPAKPSIQQWQNGNLTVALDTGVSAPSDCVIGPDGCLWFTDPADHEIFQRGAPGHLRSWNPATGELHTWLTELAFPNGIAFGPTGTELYVAETALQTVTRYQMTDTGPEADGWKATIPHGHPDGIALDAAGWLWVAGSTGHNLMAFDPTGRMCHEIDFGPGVLVTSLCFGGPGLSRLYVTTPKGGTVLEIPAVHPGLPLPVHRQRAGNIGSPGGC